MASKITREHKAAIVQLRRAQPFLAASEIGQRYGISKSTVNRVLRDGGLGQGSDWWTNDRGRIVLNNPHATHPPTPKPIPITIGPKYRPGRISCRRCDEYFDSFDVRLNRLCPKCNKFADYINGLPFQEECSIEARSARPSAE